MSFVNEKLKEFETYIKGKKVAIIGLGVSNIPLLDYLYEKGAIVSIFDKKEKDAFDKELLLKIEKYSFTLYSGKDFLNNLKGFDIIFRSPSCRPDTPEL